MTSTLKRKTDRKKIIIIGGGTAGLTIAMNLQNYFEVVVIERSQYKKYPFWYRIPLLIGLLFKSRKAKYIYKRDYILSNGRHIPFFESNLLGGASVMNGCVHVLGSKEQWSFILKKINSSYSDLLKSYKNLYSSNAKDKGKISLSTACQNDIDKAFIESLNLKKVHCGDMGHSNNEACGPILNTVKKYFRTSVLTLIKKKNFQQTLNENVESLLFNDEGSVIGVTTSTRNVYSDYVVLSGGVVGTCEFLLKEKLRGNKTDFFLSNLDVGKNIQDHTN